MSCIRVNEVKWASIIILEKILDMEKFEHATSILKTDDEKEMKANRIMEHILLDGMEYDVSNSIFDKVMRDLNDRKIIELIQLQEESEIDLVNDEFSYIKRMVIDNPDLTEEELQERKTFYCSFVVKDLKKAKQEIRQLNKRGVSIKKLNTSFSILEQESREKQFVIFDADASVLTINKTEIKVKKFGREYYLLKTIFEDGERSFEEWFFSDIAEKFDTSCPPVDKIFYNATDQLKKKIAMKVRIDDFFITTKQTIKINNKYRNAMI